MAYQGSDDILENLPSWREIRRYLPLAVGAIILLALIIGASSSAYKVGAEGHSVIKRFGKVINIKGPGLHFKLPFGIDKAIFVPTQRVLKEEFGYRTRQAGQRTSFASSDDEYKQEALMLTGDLNVVATQWVVQYRISDPDKFIHQVRQQRKSIRDVSEAVMRRVVGNRISRDVLTVGRTEIANTVQEEMGSIMGKYDMGVHIRNVKMQDVAPPVESVKDAFNEVNQAKQQKETLINEAKKRRNQKIPRAEGEAKQIVEEAKGYKAERVNIAKGQASRFEAILTEYQQAPEVTRRRLYIETMDKILPSIKKLYITGKGTNATLPLLKLQQDNEKE